MREVEKTSGRGAEAKPAAGAGDEKKTGAGSTGGSGGAGGLPAVSMPKGGGAIRGIGEKFAANPVTGTGAMTVPIAVSPGRSGFGPQLSLSYDSGSGNGPFGFGWSLSLPSITRKTDKGLPRYRDDEESDVFIVSGAEDLVPMLDESGDPVEVGRGDHRVKSYRQRTEGLFARIERWTHTSSGAVHWRSISKDNITTLYGCSDNSRIADGTRIFSWLICESRDDRGNAIVYRYAEEDAVNADTTAANERNRSRTANRYVKRIRYGNRVSCLQAGAIDAAALLTADFIDTDADWMFETVFDYGEHHDDDPLPDPADEADPQTWLCRPDPFSSYRSGFEVRHYRLCRRVLMFHHFDGVEGVGGNCLVRSTDFSYAEGPVASFLTSVTQKGYRRDESSYTDKALPPLDFEYSAAVIDETVHEVDEKSLEGLPVGLGAGYQFADLDGEGSSGVLVEQGAGWFYKRNLSANNIVPGPDGDVVAALFAPSAAVRRRPNIALSGGARLVDLAGDGTLDVAGMGGPMSGFYERDGDDWAPFRSFDSTPTVDFNDPNLRLVDLTGDGHADILITGDEVFTWYPSKGESGFGPAETARKPWDEETGPRVIFADGTESIFLADMSGDGLTDLARVRNGEVCYWPSLGYGRFGAMVTMDHSPVLDAFDQFDPKRVRLADIDGSGNTDILYLSGSGVKVVFNQSGNGWSDVRVLGAYPATDNLSSVEALDLLGIGTACLVWSSPLPGSGRRPMRYIDLMGGVKPHLMTKSKNNMGAETRVRYAPSTRFYLRDRALGRPWVTRLPFVVHTVERVETADLVSGNRFVTRYAYHHGHFDGAEREFRGFGMVEQWDTEEFSALSANGTLSDGTNIDAASHIPPVFTRTWFHTGAFAEGGAISLQFASEYFREAGLSDEAFAASLLPDTVLPADLDAGEIQEACRALKGSVLRREVYALDGTEKAALPYTVTEQNYTIECLQPRGDQRHAVFFVRPRETIDYQHERDTSDPRVKHALTLAVDAWGNVLESAAVGYGRIAGNMTGDLNEVGAATLPVYVDAGDENLQEQTRTHVVYTVNQYTNDIDDNDDRRAPLPAETCVYEVTGLSFTGRFAFDALRTALAGATGIDYEVAPSGGAQRRLIEQTRTHYRGNDGADASLGLFNLQSRALPYESYTKVFTPGLLNDADRYDGIVTQSMLDDAGYHYFGGANEYRWARTGRVLYAPATLPQGVTAAEFAEAHFFLPHRFVDPFGNESSVTYDGHDLLVTETEDALGNVTAVENDFRVLAPSMLTDPNENRTAFAFDELGLVTKTAAMGKSGANEGDDLDHPTAIFDYHLECYTDNQTPVYVRTETREKHYHPDEPSPDNARRIAYLYSDGLGREIQTKIQAEPGDVPGVTGTVDPRWVGSGWTIYNNKGLPVRKYEPFFSDTSDFEFAREEGVSPIVFYDPLGRAVGTLQPDHTWEKVVFTPWKQRAYDRNDTVMMAPTTDEDVGDFFARLDEGAYSPSWHDTYSGGTDAQQDAAEKAEVHADTPSTTWFDALGRAFLSAADDGTDPLFTRTVLDIEGNALRVIDARGVVVMTTAYDVAGRPMMTSSPDAGDRVMFADVAGKPLLTWDSRDQRFRIEYDEVRRPIGTYLSVSAGAEKLVTQTIFGDSDHADAPANPAILNHRGRVYIQRDGSGETTFDAYDFKGNLWNSTRQLADDFKNVLDWSETVTLEAESFETETEYDALNRVTSHTTPDDSETLPTYNEAGLLESVDVKLRGASSATAFVTNIDYNARGQRTKIEYGNGTVTEYEYDAATFRLTNLTTTRTSDSKVLQDLAYTYDPSGNITKIADAVQKATYFDNTVVDLEKDFTYDAIYRLIQATGREHPGQQPNDVEYPRANDIPHPNDPALRGYTEYYAYDDVGNILEMRHANGSEVWKRRYQIAEDSNRLLATSLPGDNDQTYSAQYTHDAHGNMTAMPHLALMEWDENDRLRVTSAGASNQPKTYYVYDASGQRTRKVTENENGVRTKERLYLGGFEIYREYVAGDLELEREAIHVLDDKQRIALVETQTWDEGEEVEEPEPLLRFQLADHLGSATVETDDAGTIVTYEEYFPFGGAAFHSATTAIPKRYRYTGKERDDETGLYYYGARYYASWLGRWTAADSSGLEDGPNRYAYVKDNPIRFNDPTGNTALEIAAAFAEQQEQEGLSLAAQSYAQKDYVGTGLFLTSSASWTVIKKFIPTDEDVAAAAMMGPVGPIAVEGTRVKSLMNKAVNKLEKTEAGRVILKAGKTEASAIGKSLKEKTGQKLDEAKNFLSKVKPGANPDVLEKKAVEAAVGRNVPKETLKDVAESSITPKVKDVDGRGFATHETTGGNLLSATNRAGEPYPKLIDPRTSAAISNPPTGLTRVPKTERVAWGPQERGAFIKEWYDLGYQTPEGGWGKYDIHHIIPREYGGSNAFNNLVPVLRDAHMQQFNQWWRNY